MARPRTASPRSFPQAADRHSRYIVADLTRFDWDRRFTRDDWLDQVPTSAFWAQIPVAGQREILAGFGAAIDAAGGGFTVQYATVTVTATRASTA